MTKTVIAIGGGSFGQMKNGIQKPMETFEIDKKMVELTGKQHPKLVFIGAAHGDDLSRFLAIEKYFTEQFGCVVENLNLIDASKRPNADDLKKIILGADIIYVGGGNVTYLMKVLSDTGVDKLLRQAYDQGIIMAGNSAGGCAWFEYYGNDEDDDFDSGNLETLKTKPALGLVRGYFVPHWNTKSENKDVEGSVSRNSIRKMLTKENKWGYAVDEGAAIMVQTDDKNNQTMTEIISKPGAKTYKLMKSEQQHINLGKGRE